MELHFRAILLVVGLLHALPVGGARHSPVLQLTATNSTSGSLSSLRAGLEYAYFERQYAGGWFTAGPVLNTHVEASMMSSVLSKRKTTHIPDSIDAYTISYPQTFAYFNIMWQPNSNNLAWRVVYEEDGTTFQASLNEYISEGFQLKQLSSYAYDNKGSIYYAAIFVETKAWPASTQFDAAFGLPYDAAYCCGPSSRWTSLQQRGFKPASVSVTEDPVTRKLYIADVWNSVYVGLWQGGIGKTWSQLGDLVVNLKDQMTPVYIKAYRVSNRFNGHDVFYAYLAYKQDSAPALTLTTDVSRSGWAVLAKLLKKPPVAFTVTAFDGEVDYDIPGSGEMYTALWEGVTVSN